MMSKPMMSKPVASSGASQLQSRSGSQSPMGPRGPQGSSLANQGGLSQPQGSLKGPPKTPQGISKGYPAFMTQGGASQSQNKARGTASSAVRTMI